MSAEPKQSAGPSGASLRSEKREALPGRGSEGPGQDPSTRGGQELAARAGVVGGWTLGSRVLGLVREMVIAHIFGASAAVDAFFAAFALPNLLRRLVAEGALTAALVPAFSEARMAGLATMRSLLAAVLGALLPALGILCALGALFPSVAVAVFAVGFEPERAVLAAELCRLMMPYVFFVTLLAVAGGALNAFGVFATPAAAPAVLNLSMIAFAVGATGASREPIEALAIGVSVGGALQLALQAPALLRRQLVVLPRLGLRHPGLARLGLRILPGVLGIGVYQLNIAVVRALGSFRPPGELACYGFAIRLQDLALGVFAVSVAIAALPSLSDQALRGDASGLRRTLGASIRATSFLTAPSAVALTLLAQPIVTLLFRHGAFDHESANLTATLVQVLAVAIVPIGAARVVVPVFYACGKTRLPVVAAALSLALTVTLGLVVQGPLGMPALTAVTVLAAGLQLGILALGLTAVLGDGSRGAQTPQDAQGPQGPQNPQDPAGPRNQAASLYSLGLGREVLGHGLRCLASVMLPALLAAPVVWLYPWTESPRFAGATVLTALLLFLGVSYFLVARYLGVEESIRVLAWLRARCAASRASGRRSRGGRGTRP